MFQSPRSGKFVSNLKECADFYSVEREFQSPRSGEFVSNNIFKGI